MITESAVDHEAFKEMLKRLYDQNIQSDYLQKFKEKAWQRLQELGLPTRRSEVFQYLRLRALYKRSFEMASSPKIDPDALLPHILPECSQSVVVIANGYYRPDLSRLNDLSKRLIIMPLEEASRTYGSFLNNRWNKLLKDENDPFVVLNAAVSFYGLFIYAPPKTILDIPVQLLHVTTHDEIPRFIAPRIHGFIGSQSQLDFISTHTHLTGRESLLTFSMDIAVEDDSHIRYIQIPLNISKQTWHFDSLRATLKRNSSLKTTLVTEGSTSSRHDYRVTLMGENAETSLNGISMLSNHHEAHAHVLIDHQAPHCRSTQLFKNALDDASHSSFEGKILVQQAAQKTEAFQLNNNLLLSDKAKADSKPNLEIFADDVKASHGATVGQLDSEQLFYLKTRGYSEQTAKNLLVYGFCKEVLDLIPIPSLAKEINHRAKKYLGALQ